MTIRHYIEERVINFQLIMKNKLSTRPEVLLGKSLEELTSWIEEQGQPAYRGKQLYQWLYHKGARSLNEITVFPKKFRESVAEQSIGRSQNPLLQYCS